MRKIKIIFVFFMALFVGGCATSRGTGAVVSDLGIGASEYRAIQGELREGEAELAITGTAIEHRSGHIASGIAGLEQAISASQGTEQEIGDIIQRVRARPVDPDLVEEWRNRRSETEPGGTNPGDGEI